MGLKLTNIVGFKHNLLVNFLNCNGEHKLVLLKTVIVANQALACKTILKIKIAKNTCTLLLDQELVPCFLD